MRKCAVNDFPCTRVRILASQLVTGVLEQGSGADQGHGCACTVRRRHCIMFVPVSLRFVVAGLCGVCQVQSGYAYGFNLPPRCPVIFGRAERAEQEYSGYGFHGITSFLAWCIAGGANRVDSLRQCHIRQSLCVRPCVRPASRVRDSV